MNNENYKFKLMKMHKYCVSKGHYSYARDVLYYLQPKTLEMFKLTYKLAYKYLSGLADFHYIGASNID